MTIVKGVCGNYQKKNPCDAYLLGFADPPKPHPPRGSALPANVKYDKKTHLLGPNFGISSWAENPFYYLQMRTPTLCANVATNHLFLSFADRTFPQRAKLHTYRQILNRQSLGYTVGPAPDRSTSWWAAVGRLPNTHARCMCPVCCVLWGHLLLGTLTFKVFALAPPVLGRQTTSDYMIQIWVGKWCKMPWYIFWTTQLCCQTPRLCGCWH